ncbi:hypothetical protein ABFX02_13G013400 [Erythranthe guttata]
MVPGLPQQAGDPVTTEMHNPENGGTRKYMQFKILEFLLNRRQQTREVPKKKMEDLVRCLEEGLYKTATTKNEYLNLETLGSRLSVLIKPLTTSSHNQQNYSASTSTMIPTPEFQEIGSSSFVGSSSIDG